MDHRRSVLISPDGLVGDLLRRHQQIFRHGGRVELYLIFLWDTLHIQS